MTNDTGTLVIGASAAGLSVAACLKRAGQPFELLEATEVVGKAWRSHYDRLHLHTPKSASGLPGLPMPADWPKYPAREQVVEYLERYSAHHGLTPRFGESVTSLTRGPDMTWTATTSKRTWTARNVVIATGYTRKPVRPTWEGMASYRGTLLHSSEYKNGDPWKGRPVLMIGFGNSACEQAIDLVERCAEAHLSVRSAVNVVQRDLLGLVPILAVGATMRHLPTWLADALSWPLVRLTVGDITKVGLKKLPYGPNHQIKHDRRIPLLDIGTMDHIRAGRIRVHGGVTRFTEDGVVFEDGSAHAFDAVVLGTGYRPALEEFLPAAAEVCDPKGMPLASGGQSKLPGLYFCGFYVSPAGMLREIGLEAQRITKEIAS